MYDTAAGLITAPQLAESSRWGKVISTHNPRTGEVSTRHVLNTDAGMQLTLLNGATLMAERSLPKALYRTNVRELDQGDLPNALARVDAEIAEALHADLPPFGEWQPVRADYCRNDPLGDELAVRRALREARDVVLARKGKPMQNQAETWLRWPGRSYGFKLYSKFAESREPGAEGLLRAEATVRHLKTFRTLLGRERGEPVQLLDVLKPEVRAEVMARFSDVFERCPVSARELSSRKFAEEFTRYFIEQDRPGRALTLLGFCYLYRLAGYPTAQEIGKGKRVFGFKRAAVYKYLADLREFRKYLVEKGYQHAALTADANPQEVGLDDLLGEEQAALADDRKMIELIANMQTEQAA